VERGELSVTYVERQETAVMFIRTADEPAEMAKGWEQLEGLVGLRGQKFFGTFDSSTGEYRVCVEIRENDEPAPLGLETGTIPGGAYLRARLRGDPPAVYERIAPTFDALIRSAADAHDESRPSIEFYRRLDEIDLLLPVVGESADAVRTSG
jgi:GyrI-like small molecule binding domain